MKKIKIKKNDRMVMIHEFFVANWQCDFKQHQFHNCNDTHGGRIIHQVHKITKENQQMSLMITEKIIS